MSKTGITIDTHNFNNACKEMARLTGAKYEDIVKAEIGNVLSAAIGHTAKATSKSIESNLAQAIWIKRDGGKTNGGTVYPMKWRYSDDLWQDIQSNKGIRLKELIARIGTAKKSWYLLAQRLNIKLPKPVPAYVTKAAVNGGELTKEVSATRNVSGSKVGFLLENSTRAAVKGGGKKALLKAINGRTGYFHTNLRKGVFKKVAAIAKSYPGFKIRGI